MDYKTVKLILLSLTGFLLLVFIFGSGVITGWWLRSSYFSNYLPTDQKELKDLFIPYFQSWELVHEKYIEQPVNDLSLMQSSIRGMMAGLNDPYSLYLGPSEYRQVNASMQGEYTGIGAWVNTGGEFLEIISPMPNSPAEQAGLKPGDLIVAINSEDTTGLHPDIVLSKIIGPAGTKLTITVIREGKVEPLTFEVTRAVIDLPSIQSELIENKIAYIHLYRFSEDADKEFRAAYQELLKSNPIGLILDLRNNAGGYVNSAIDITSEFIHEGLVMIEEFNDGTRKEYAVKDNGIAYDIPLVIIINRGSASASEILAGALQDYGRGQLIGETTHGKGVVQQEIKLQGDNGALRITISRWLTPTGRQIHKFGLTPDVEVLLTKEDYDMARDRQKEVAIQHLIQSIG